MLGRTTINTSIEESDHKSVLLSFDSQQKQKKNAKIH